MGVLNMSVWEFEELLQRISNLEPERSVNTILPHASFRRLSAMESFGTRVCLLSFQTELEQKTPSNHAQ